MPEVGYDKKPTRHNLRTVEGGYVELRRLPYNELLYRREMGTKLSMEQTQRKGRKQRQQDQEQQRIDIELAQVITREYEFANCITDHNLTINGQPVDFTRPKEAFRNVDPKVLQEIELLLSNLNDETDEDELEDFTEPSTTSSLDEPTQLLKPTEAS